MDTKDKPDEYDGTKQRVDACLFHKDDLPKETKKTGKKKATRTSPNWDLHKLHIEFKSSHLDDAFVDKENNGDCRACEAESTSGYDTRGQIISYAALVFKYQHRCFFFTLLVLGTEARIIRWDRAGAVVTDRFNYQQNPEILCEFLDKFACLKDTQGLDGIDSTVTLATADEQRKMEDAASDENKLDFRDYARVYFKRSLNPNRKWWKIAVDAEPSPQNGQDSDASGSAASEKRYFLVGTPRFCSGGMTGRGTRGYVALDLEKLDEGYLKFVWLKDAWRVDHEGIGKEGLILRKLNLDDVRYVPTLLCHGDVAEQRTSTLR